MQRVWFGLAVVALVAAAWMGRYEATSVSDFRFVLLDRWTGQATVCLTAGC